MGVHSTNSTQSFFDDFYRSGTDAVTPKPPLFSASGGNVDALAPGNGYKYHTFTSSGSFTVSAGTKTAEILLVGGGGGGGPSSDSNSGGGGAGGLIYWNSIPLTPGTYPVTIGNGGAAGQNNGQDSVFDPGNPLHLVALGGGYAGGGPRGASYAGADGGSGGGGSGFQSDTAGGSGIQTTSAPLPANSRTYGFGTDGGSTPGYTADGGGGAGGAGNSNPSSGTAAGPGKQISGFEGNTIGVPALQPLNGYYAGGGGSNHPYGTAGGAGGGGSWPGTNNDDGNPGTANSGGGGAGSYAYASGGAGGSGICVIRYPV